MFVGYARVSTKDQHLELQIDALNAAGCEHIYKEKMSGRRGDRPVLAAALARMQPGDTLIVWKLSRLGRSFSQVVNTLQWLIDNGIGFKSLHESLDVNTLSGKYFCYSLAIFAEIEADNGRQNTRAGIAAFRARGGSWGPRLKLTDELLAKARRLFMAEPRPPIREICKELNVSKATLYRHVKFAA